MRRVIGIDPGLAGGVGIFNLDAPGGDQRVSLHRVPVIEFKKGGRKKREYDLPQMAELLRMNVAGSEVRVGIEAQNPHPDEGVVSAMRLGLGVGFWEGLLTGLGIPYERVYPIVWKKHHGLLRQPKAMSRVLVGRLFPAVAGARAVEEGPCEALLIAVYVAWHQGWLGVTPKYNGPAPAEQPPKEEKQIGLDL